MDNNTYIDDIGVIYETDEDGIQHAYHTWESWDRLQDVIDAMDRLQAHLGLATKQDMLDYFEGDQATMYEAAMRLVVD